MSKKQANELPPIEISTEAHRALVEKVKVWTGWRDAGLRFATPVRSKYAECDHEKHMVTANPEALILNPNRVLLTVTPFRLRQEAVLTGSLLHEAGHARHTHWKARTQAEYEARPMPLHSDGTPATPQVLSLAVLMEEPRVEGLMAVNASSVGADGLEWTMRASAARLIAPTDLSEAPAQAVMDLITSWALRAGRQIALSVRLSSTANSYRPPRWVNQFTSVLGQAIEAHLTERETAGADLGGETPNYRALQVTSGLTQMIMCDDDTGPTMIDLAREVLNLLFPETPDDDDSDSGDGEAMAGSGCGDSKPEDSESDSDSEPEGGESDSDEENGESEPENQDSDGPAEDDEDGEPDDGDGDNEPSATDSTEAPEASPTLAQRLAELEALSGEETEDEAEEMADDTTPDSNTGAGEGFGGWGNGWRRPSASERDTQKGAERFLRDLIDASEMSKRTLTDQPSAVVDGAAMSAWKAGGQVRDPHFFVRTHRTVEPSPPIEIAILVDVSASMEELQEPSALLSWALSSAALDLRNFAGRGQQVSSCLIHWGSRVQVVQKPGQMLPGIREVSCNQGTSVMHEAIAEIENLIPGFFDPARNVNRLLVQFTDWELLNSRLAGDQVARALAAGVNMLSVVPRAYSPRYSDLPSIIRMCKIQRGSNTLIKYDPYNPGRVWDQASELLDASAVGQRPAPFPGF